MQLNKYSNKKNNPRKVLVFIEWFLPAYKAGGPIQSISNIVSHLKKEIDFWIYTSNHDIDKDLELPPSQLNRWIHKDGYNIMYSDSKNQNFKKISHVLRTNNFDVVHLNSLFSLKYSLLPLLVSKNMNIKVLLAPRGMLGDGALAIKPFKKTFFIKIFKLIKLNKKLIWHATDVSESNEIKKHFGQKSQILIAPNLSKKVVHSFGFKKKEKNTLNVFFLSRITQKKNILGALELVNKLDKKIKLTFQIIGPIEDKKYWGRCLDVISKFHSNIRVKYLGPVHNNEIIKILKDQHIMLFPTKHENFGHVILEAWQSGCPVIISNNTPWKNLSKDKLGYEIENDNILAYVEALENFANMDATEFNKWSESAYNFGKNFSENKDLIDQTKELYEP